jgi:hypothetical protein
MWAVDVGAGGCGKLIRRWSSNSADAAQVENDAEEPRPAPTGSVDRAVKLNESLSLRGKCYEVRG